MEYINYTFLGLSLFNGMGTLISALQLKRSDWDEGAAISASVSLLWSAFTAASAQHVLMLPIPNWWAFTFAPAGILIVIIGQVLSIWARKEMKKNFSPKLVPLANSSLVTTGPFCICRHPMMLSYLMLWIGTTIALGSLTMFVAFGFVSIVIVRRIAMEEKLLAKHYGDQFKTYQERTSAIVPFLNPGSKDGAVLEEAIARLNSIG